LINPAVRTAIFDGLLARALIDLVPPSDLCSGIGANPRGGKDELRSIRVGDTLVQLPAAEYFTAFKRHGRWVAGGEFGGEATITIY